ASQWKTTNENVHPGDAVQVPTTAQPLARGPKGDKGDKGDPGDAGSSLFGPFTDVTTNNVPKNIPLDDAPALGVRIYTVSAQAEAGTISHAWVKRVAVQRTTLGAISIVGQEEDEFEQWSDSLAEDWSLTFTIADGAVVAVVRGGAGQTIAWRVSYALS